MFMSEFPVEAVGEGEDKSVTLPESKMIVVILERLLTICSGEKFAGSLYWEPKGEFRYRARQRGDRIFRVRIFEGRDAA
jgi:hypothetical protein